MSPVSFAAAVKAELAHLFPDKPCCQQAELAAVLSLAGELKALEGAGGILVSTRQASVARLVYRLVKECCGAKPTLVIRPRSFGLLIPVTPEVISWASRWPGLLDPKRPGSLRQLRRSGLALSCCRCSFLRGSFLAAGSLNDPRSGYHLEVRLPSAAWGAYLGGLLASFGLAPHLTTRRGTPLLYLKGGEQVAQFLNLVGAHAAYLEMESARVYKEVKGRVNRLVNCDTANLGRTVEASMRQAAAIAYLDNRLGLSNLPKNLREVAELRLAHPDASLKELGQMFSPRLGKAAVRHRLRQLEELAGRLAGQE